MDYLSAVSLNKFIESENLHLNLNNTTRKNPDWISSMPRSYLPRFTLVLLLRIDIYSESHGQPSLLWAVVCRAGQGGEI